MKFTFVRHGQTDWNRDKRLMTPDIPLNEEGRQQMFEIRKILSPDFDVVYTSPVVRAYESAQIINAVLHLPLLVDTNLVERNFGSLAGKTWEEIVAEHGPALQGLDKTQNYDYSRFGGESAEQVRKRVLDFITILKQSVYEHPLVMSHGGVIRTLHFLYSPQPPVVIENGSIHEFEI
jgi:broad specificity phosphatase PhoE